jgi:hypothetical protein
MRDARWRKAGSSGLRGYVWARVGEVLHSPPPLVWGFGRYAGDMQRSCARLDLSVGAFVPLVCVGGGGAEGERLTRRQGARRRGGGVPDAHRSLSRSFVGGTPCGPDRAPVIQEAVACPLFVDGVLCSVSGRALERVTVCAPQTLSHLSPPALRLCASACPATMCVRDRAP